MHNVLLYKFHLKNADCLKFSKIFLLFMEKACAVVRSNNAISCVVVFSKMATTCSLMLPRCSAAFASQSCAESGPTSFESHQRGFAFLSLHLWE